MIGTIHTVTTGRTLRRSAFKRRCCSCALRGILPGRSLLGWCFDRPGVEGRLGGIFNVLVSMYVIVKQLHSCRELFYPLDCCGRPPFFISSVGPQYHDLVGCRRLGRIEPISDDASLQSKYRGSMVYRTGVSGLTYDIHSQVHHGVNQTAKCSCLRRHAQYM